MIAIQEKNVHVFRTEGDTDEQASVLKEVFSDLEFVKQYNVCSVNSINWFRIAAQASYYFWSYFQVVENIGLCHFIKIIYEYECHECFY